MIKKRLMIKTNLQVGDCACEAIERMLTFNPSLRACADECLALPYYEALHLPEDEPLCSKVFNWEAARVPATEELLRNHFFAECWKFDSSVALGHGEVLKSRGIDKLLC